jgi:hypothetical protein
MKTTAHFRPLLLLLVALLSQSCGIKGAMSEGSLDLFRHKFAGPSYAKGNFPAPDAEEFGYNLGILFVVGEQAFMGPGPFSQSAPTNLLATTSNQLSFGLGYAPPKPNSLFTNKHFALMSGLELIRKGSNISDVNGKNITHLLYLEVPIYALYRHYLPDNKGELFGGLGPYFGYGLTGTFKSTFNGQTFKSSAFDTKNGGYKRFDAGLAFTAGYQLPSSLRIRLAYELGLVNIESGPAGGFGDKTFNRGISLNVGYPVDKIVDKFKKRY